MPVFRRDRDGGRRSPAQAVATLRAASAVHLRERARAARNRAFVLLPLVVTVLLLNRYRMNLFQLDVPVRVASAVALVGLGAWFARDFTRALGPGLARHMDAGTAGTIGFILRLVLLIVAVIAAL